MTAPQSHRAITTAAGERWEEDSQEIVIKLLKQDYRSFVTLGGGKVEITSIVGRGNSS